MCANQLRDFLLRIHCTRFLHGASAAYQGGRAEYIRPTVSVLMVVRLVEASYHKLQLQQNRLQRHFMLRSTVLLQDMHRGRGVHHPHIRR